MAAASIPAGEVPGRLFRTLVRVRLGRSGSAPAVRKGRAEPHTPIQIHESLDTMTGTSARLLHVPGPDPLDVALLFLARADLRGARKSAWHLRTASLPGMPGTWGRILAGPRYGHT